MRVLLGVFCFYSGIVGLLLSLIALSTHQKTITDWFWARKIRRAYRDGHRG